MTLDTNAAQTFDGLARAAEAGAARVFNVRAMLMPIQPDGQLRPTSSSPGQPGPVQRGGPVELAHRVAGRLLGPGHVSAATRL